MLCAAALLGQAAFGQATAPDSPPALRFSWADADHASGVYHIKDEAHCAVFAENVSAEAANLSGEILFGSVTPVSEPGKEAEFKTLSVTPITPATLGPREKAKVPMAVSFGAAGEYQLRLQVNGRVTPIESAAGVMLQCIFAPRDAEHLAQTPWITTLPKAAVRTPGYLADFISQTTIHRFLIDERFAFDETTGVGLGFGASTGAGGKEVDAFLADAARAKAHLVLRVSVPAAAPDMRRQTAFKEYLTDAIRRSGGALTAIAIVPAEGAGDPSAFQTYYLAGYAAAKRADKNILFLGAGSAEQTERLLGRDLRSYIDAVAIADAAGEPAAARRFLDDRKVPLWVLPALGMSWPPPAASLAQGAAVAPVAPPEIDRGVTAHLLNGTVFFQRVRRATPDDDKTDAGTNFQLPFIAVFQGDGYALAAIAGLSAGTDLDAAYPALARTRSQVQPVTPDEKPPYPHLEVSDDTHTMRVVDAEGSPVDCRVGDSLYVPAEEKIVYLLQAGPAEDLAGSLRPAVANHFPVFEIGLSQAVDGAVTLKLRNITAAEVGGKYRLLRPSTTPQTPPEVLSDGEFVPVLPGKALEIPIRLKETAPLARPLVAEITTDGNKPVIQRTAIPALVVPAH